MDSRETISSYKNAVTLNVIITAILFFVDRMLKLPREEGSVYTNVVSITSTRFNDFETASKSMRFGNVYTESFSPGNQSHNGMSERCTTCKIHHFESGRMQISRQIVTVFKSL